MTSLQELMQQRAALDQQIGELKKRETREAIDKVRQIVTQFELTAKDIFPAGGSKKPSTAAKVAPKYRDPVSGEVWTGRGKTPKWLEGKDRESFLITA